MLCDSNFKLNGEFLNFLYRVRRAALLMCAAAALTFAGTIVAPGGDASTEGNGNNGFPFNLGNFGLSSMRYQQVYAASEFSSLGGPVLITAIDFRPDASIGGAFSSTLSDIQIDLSTTSITPSTISSTFANNVGGDDLTVFSGALSLSSSFTGPGAGPKDFDIVINLITPFLYDPANGSLLLDVRNFGGGSTTQFDADTTTTSVGRVWALSSAAETGTVDGGTNALVTQFVFTETPEPSTISMVGLAVLGLGMARLRRKA
jgi:PEP-CTERM motif